MSALITIAIVTILILLNGLFVAAEFAIVGAPRAAIENRAARGDKGAGRVHRILENPRLQDRYIATAQLGITLASLGLGMYGEHTLAEFIAHQLEAINLPSWLAAHVIATVVAIAVLTYFHIVIGEMIPKSISLQKAESAAIWITPIMNTIQMLLFPLVVILNGIGNLSLRLLGIQRQEGHEHYYSSEELQFIIQESQEGGLLRDTAADVIKELFEFGDLTATEVMIPRVRVHGIPLGTEPRQLAQLMQETPHTRFPVYNDNLDHIVGMIHIKDLLRLLIAQAPITLSELRAVPYVPETATLDQVMAAMREARTQMAVVMDEHGGTAGIITIDDMTEEVTGAIVEEERPHLPIVEEAPGQILVEGTVRLDEVGEALDVVLEHEEVDTVSGLVLAFLGRPPRVNDRVTYDHVQFVVTAIEGRGVSAARVTRLAPPVTEEAAE